MNDDFISSSIATGMRSPMLAGGGGGAGGVAGGGVGPSMLSMSLAAQTIKSRGPSHGRRTPWSRDSRGRFRSRSTVAGVTTVGKQPPRTIARATVTPSDEITREETRNSHHITDIIFRLSCHALTKGPRTCAACTYTSVQNGVVKG